MLIGLFKSLIVCFMVLIGGFKSLIVCFMALIDGFEAIISLFKSLSVCFMMLSDGLDAMSGDVWPISPSASEKSRRLRLSCEVIA